MSAPAVVASARTPGSVLMEVIRLTVPGGLCKSMSRLRILIRNLSPVVDPSPRGAFPAVVLGTLAGARTGPSTWRCFSQPPIKSAHAFSTGFTLRLPRVVPTLWTATSGPTGVFRSLSRAWLRGRLPGPLARRCRRAGAGGVEPRGPPLPRVSPQRRGRF